VRRTRAEAVQRITHAEYCAWRLPGAGTVGGAHIRGFWRAPLETYCIPATATVTGRELTCRCRRPTSEYRQYPISAYLAAAPPETPTHLQADLLARNLQRWRIGLQIGVLG